MNYRHVYMLIIEHAKKEVELGLRPKNRYFKKNFSNQYFEFHHILPKSLFSLWSKRKSNIIPLTAREHFFCHQLLTKIYNTSEMRSALYLLVNINKHNKLTSKQYEKLKIERTKDISIKLKHYIKTEEHCRNISKSRKGAKNSIPRSAEYRMKISKLHKGKKKPESAVNKMKRSLKEYYKTHLNPNKYNSKYKIYCITNNTWYSSPREASESLGISYDYIRRHVKDNGTIKLGNFMFQFYIK